MAAAKAVARVKEQTSFTGRWGGSEHLALLRYMCLDAIVEASNGKVGTPLLDKAGKPIIDKDGKPRVHTVVSLVNIALKQAFDADPELSYASNFDKLLKKCGEIPEGNEYE